MKNYDLKRRQFLRLLMSLPVGLVIGCDLRPYESLVYARTLTPEESLRKLILLLGPWSATDREKAEDFVRRFLRAKHNIDPYLPVSSELVQSLASRFPDGTLAIKEIVLQSLPTKEKELLMNMVKHLYSLIDVRSEVSEWPPWGECLTDETWHTRAPVLGKI
ncbi:MAG: hypothetical protein GTO13_23285 [Proteobacteria bacterium]|nr:hypothetical protein [Pseudomonadota bacterium]NIS63502.1 hypothetical protein [Pseudomonadota bacterium]